MIEHSFCECGKAENPKYSKMWLLEQTPQLYSNNPKTYIVYSIDLGKYNKKEAELICEFLKKFYNFI